MSPKAPRTDDDRTFDTAVGERVRQFRLAAGLNQTQLAKASGVTFQQIQKYERGANRIAASRLVSIARAVGVPASQLLGEGEEPSSVDAQLRNEVARLSSKFLQCSPQGRAAIQALAASLAAS